MEARKRFRFRRQTKAATFIQARWRCHKASSYYRKLKRGTTKTQCRWRGKLAKKELRKLKQAARDTGALKEAKDKLEKQLEELTWRLQLEKRLRLKDMAQHPKFGWLQEPQVLHSLPIANTLVPLPVYIRKLVINERKVTLKDKENLTLCMEKINPGETTIVINKSNKIFKVSMRYKRCNTPDITMNNIKKMRSTKTMRREWLEEKLNNWELENKILRQQVVSMAPNKFISGSSRSIIQRSESGHIFGDAKMHLNHHDNNDVLAYWLSTASTLLLPLQRTLKASGHSEMALLRLRSSSAALFGKMSHSFRGSPHGVNISFVNGLPSGFKTLRQVEAKYPALLFKQQLIAYVEKIYGMIRDNLKKEISPLLGLCIQFFLCKKYIIWNWNSSIQSSRTSRASLVKGPSRSIANTASQQALIAHWQGIVKSLGNFLNTLKANHVPPFLVRKVFDSVVEKSLAVKDCSVLITIAIYSFSVVEKLLAAIRVFRV
ncbi:Myosin-11 [Olea europaea subsp. europaea]|uniref:Myosin-11 n=1 Tax=Olea europaea subsp. europaea TaxID=158383 RepID=A0A8S0T8U5_OLEEU|nr:Myosin-11 [Olea europaea subsp. europaea]